MKDHTDNKISLDYSLQLSTLLDNKERSILTVGANGVEAVIRIKVQQLHDQIIQLLQPFLVDGRQRIIEVVVQVPTKFTVSRPFSSMASSSDSNKLQ